MRDGWQSQPIEKIATIISGGTPKSGVAEFWEGDVLWITPKDMGKLKSDYVFDTSRKITNVGLAKSSAKLVPENSVILSTRAPIGYLAINREAMATNQGCRGLVPLPILDTKFLFHFLRMNVPLLNDLGSGTTFKELSKGALSGVEVPLPPLPEQKRIVSILDKAFSGIDKAIANAEQNLDNARELFESYLNNIFTQKGDGWVDRSLSEVCSISSKLIDPREPDYVDLPHLGAGNMISRTGEMIEIKTAREESLISGKFLFDTKMVLYSKIRPYLMKACRPDFVGLCSADVYPLVPDIDFLDRDFLFHLLMSHNFTEYAISGSARAGMPKVNREHLFNYRFYLPCTSEQRKLCSQLDNLFSNTKHLETIYQQKLDDLDELKQSILQKAFAGELTQSTAEVIPITSRSISNNTTSPAFSANVIAFAYYRHATKNRDKTFGRVKEQKTLHLIESIGGIDLGRNPVKDAAGPNDFDHMFKAEAWAKKERFFEFIQRPDGGYDFKKLVNYDKMITQTLMEIKPYKKALDKVVDLICPMDTETTEVFATVHAAWNNLVLNGAKISDEAIIREARDNWHSSKMSIAKSKFRKAIKMIRDKGLIPVGTAKRVVGQESLL